MDGLALLDRSRAGGRPHVISKRCELSSFVYLDSTLGYFYHSSGFIRKYFCTLADVPVGRDR